MNMVFSWAFLYFVSVNDSAVLTMISDWVTRFLDFGPPVLADLEVHGDGGDESVTLIEGESDAATLLSFI